MSILNCAQCQCLDSSCAYTITCKTCGDIVHPNNIFANKERAMASKPETFKVQVTDNWQYLKILTFLKNNPQIENNTREMPGRLYTGDVCSFEFDKGAYDALKNAGILHLNQTAEYIADEAHTLKGDGIKRAQRPHDYLKNNPNVHYVHDEVQVPIPESEAYKALADAFNIRQLTPINPTTGEYIATVGDPVKNDFLARSQAALDTCVKNGIKTDAPLMHNWRSVANEQAKGRLRQQPDRRVTFHERLEPTVLATAAIPSGPWHILKDKNHPEYQAVLQARKDAFDAAVAECKAIVRRTHLSWPTYPDGTPKRLACVSTNRDTTAFAYWYKFEHTPGKKP